MPTFSSLCRVQPELYQLNLNTFHFQCPEKNFQRNYPKNSKLRLSKAEELSKDLPILCIAMSVRLEHLNKPISNFAKRAVYWENDKERAFKETKFLSSSMRNCVPESVILRHLLYKILIHFILHWFVYLLKQREACLKEEEVKFFKLEPISPKAASVSS